ncbi:hypothetical protein TNCT_659721 [Trichonephila clavata]|uniref:Uncharacterized protein n=1 Tax=Trichonephila clavata TaxID=2740835 RepID=A0A8X6J2R3_TRICU|nr:hypothetical protein TNCT_659721 [Trichonephila clavata]
MGEKVQSIIGEINQEAPGVGGGASDPKRGGTQERNGRRGRRGTRREGRTVDCVCNQQEERSGNWSPSTTCQMQFEAVYVVQECE